MSRLDHRAQPPPPTCSSAAPTCSTRARASTRRTTCSSAAARSPRSARPTRSRRPTAPRSLDGEGRHLFPGFVDPHVHLRTPGPGAQGGPRLRHPRRRGRRLRRGRRDAEHRPGRRLRARPALAARGGRAARRASPSASWPAITRGLRRRGADRDGRAAPTPARSASPTTASPVAPRRDPAQGAAVPAARRRRARACTRRTRRSPAAASMHEGEVVRAARRWPASRASRESTMIARDAALAGYEGGADPHPAPERARVGRGGRRGQGARRADHRRGVARTTSRSPTRRCSSGSTRG